MILDNFTSRTRIAISDSSAVYCDAEIPQQTLLQKKLYKTYSLLRASLVGIKTLPTLLLLDSQFQSLHHAGQMWKWPLMIRLDYTFYPPHKPLGGIPLQDLDTARKISNFLFSIGCYPLFHKHADRFDDEYSAGVLFHKNSSAVQIEIVGKGFDAGDLRLGKSRPHETFTYDLSDSRITHQSLIDEANYSIDVNNRLYYASKLNSYVQYVNHNFRLLPELHSLEDVPDFPQDLSPPPPYYTPIKASLRNNLFKIVEALYYEVLPCLPPSSIYVASFSYIGDHGWLLWDIYGHWYKR